MSLNLSVTHSFPNKGLHVPRHACHLPSRLTCTTACTHNSKPQTSQDVAINNLDILTVEADSLKTSGKNLNQTSLHFVLPFNQIGAFPPLVQCIAVSPALLQAYSPPAL